MTVAKFTQPNYLTQTAAAYKAAIDAALAVLATHGADYACHAKDTPDMQVLVDAGQLFLADSTLVSNAQQTSATIVAPVTNPRIDRIVINDQTGVVSVIAGTEAASPTAPAITAGTRPIAQILLQTSSTVIANSMITDERVVETYNFSDFIRTFLATATASAARAALGAASLGANTFTGTQTISAASEPRYVLVETDAAVDNGRWDLMVDGETLFLRTLNDANTLAVNILTAQRTGPVVDTVTIGGAAVSIPGLVAGLGNITRTVQSQNNSSSVTILNSSTTIVTLSLGTVVAGDRVLITGNVQNQKGGTAGHTLVSVDNTGTASGSFSHTNASLYGQSIEQPASTFFQCPVNGMYTVGTGGTLSLVLKALSEGSNGTVGAGTGEIVAIVLRG